MHAQTENQSSRIQPELVKIIPYHPTLQQQIESLVLGIQRNEFQVDITAKDQPDLLDIAGTFNVGRGGFWVAISSQRVVGTIGLLDPGHTYPYAVLKKMFVDSEFRGRETGTAQKLLDLAVESARQRKFSDVYLGTIDRYQAALRFYERNGFIEISEAQLPEGFFKVKVDNRFYRKKLERF